MTRATTRVLERAVALARRRGAERVGEQRRGLPRRGAARRAVRARLGRCSIAANLAPAVAGGARGGAALPGRRRRGRSSTCPPTRRSARSRARCPYATAKAAIEGLTRALAVDYGPRGIRTNAVALGSIVTERYDASLGRRRWRAVHPLGRAGAAGRGRGGRRAPALARGVVRQRRGRPGRRRPRGARASTPRLRPSPDSGPRARGARGSGAAPGAWPRAPPSRRRPAARGSSPARPRRGRPRAAPTASSTSITISASRCSRAAGAGLVPQGRCSTGAEEDGLDAIRGAGKLGGERLRERVERRPWSPL